MYTAQKLDVSEADAEGKSFTELHAMMLADYQAGLQTKLGSSYWNGIWASLAPSGNIYRRNGLEAELMLVSRELWEQLYQIAGDCAFLSGSLEERVQQLWTSLKAVEVKTSSMGSSRVGYPPLEEFLDREVVRWGFLLVPKASDQRFLYWQHRFLALLVFFVQILAPSFIFIARWGMDTNYLKDLPALDARMTWAEAICLGPNKISAMTTLLGTFLMAIVILVVRNDITNEVQDVEKTMRMPGNSFWYWMGNLANQSCCIATTLAILLLFWSEEVPMGLVLDSMGLLFVQKLDDLGDIVFSYIEQDDADFRRQCAWSSIILSQCPVRLSDLLNPEAKSVKDLWTIRFDVKGSLLNSKGERCLTRLCRAPADENTSLEAAPEASSAMEGELCYCRRDVSWRIPTLSGRVWEQLWHATNKLLLALQVIQPIVFYVVNDPCSVPAAREA
jgi:hypothetical protein